MTEPLFPGVGDESLGPDHRAFFLEVCRMLEHLGAAGSEGVRTSGRIERCRRADQLILELTESEGRLMIEASAGDPNSIHVPRGMLEFRADPSSPYHQAPLDPSARVILHCASGRRSALAAAVLQDMGYERVAHLDGGINAWKEAGKPVG